MNSEQVEIALKRAFQLYMADDHNGAMRVLVEVLRFHPDYYRALYGVSLALRSLENHGLALLASRRCVELSPESAEAWNSLGMSYSAVGALDAAEECFQKAMTIAPDNALCMNNLGDAAMQRFQPERALACFTKARGMKQADTILHTLDENEGYCRLALKQWARGWELYELGVGRTRHRRDCVYGDATMWDGADTGRLVIWGEQGIGDEIMFASCIPDARPHAKSVVIDTCKRLKGLFARSFPWAEVHGTRADETRPWALDQHYDRRIIMGSLPKLYRNAPEQFPGTPYLIADPQRRHMARALLDSINRVNPRRPKIGLAWTGGTPATGMTWRSMTPKDLLPITAAFPGVDWISLEYKSPEEGLPAYIHHFPFLTQTGDYDDTAALVAELDAVVTVQTAAVHLAGALGKPAFVLVSDRPVWRYGAEGSEMLWYDSVRLYRQKAGDWNDAIGPLVNDLREFIAGGHHHRRLPLAAD